MLERGEALVQIGAHLGLGGRCVQELRVGGDRRPFVVDPRLDTQ